MKHLLLLLALLGPVESLDWAVARSLQAGRRSTYDTPMQTISRVTRPPIVAAGVLVVVAVDVATGGGWSMARLAAGSLAGTNLVVEVLKRVVDRPRPDGEHKRSNASFPSSHAANAFALASVLTARWRRAGAPLFLLAGLVAFSRMYLNRHFLSDVVVGALIGVLLTWLASRWLPVVRRGRGSESPARAS